jgi:hypothetical protein
MLHRHEPKWEIRSVGSPRDSGREHEAEGSEQGFQFDISTASWKAINEQ